LADSESVGVVKIVIVLGLVFILVGALYPGESGWNQFNASIQAFPTFQNPFDERISHTPLVIADGNNDPGVGQVVNNANVTNCDDSDEDPYWGCVTTLDAAGSYIILNSSDNQFTVDSDLIPVSTTLPVFTVIVNVQCRGETDGTSQFQASINGSSNWFSETVTCTGINAWGNTTIINPFDTAYPLVSDFTGGLFRIVQVGGDLDVSFMSFTFIIGNTGECASGDTLAYIGCQLGSFFSGVIRFFRAILNGIIFLGALIGYVLSIIVAFFGMVGFMFAIPGTPAFVQALITAFIVGGLLLVIIAVLRVARGSGTTG